MKTKKLLATSMVLAMGWLAGPNASAAPYNWNVGDGEFTNSASWNPTGPPGGADSAVFNQGPANNVTFAQSVSNAGLSVYQGNVTFDLQGNTYTLTNNNPGGFLFGLDARSGVLVVTNGTLAPACQQVGGAGNGTVTVAGPGAALITGYSDLGAYGAGALNVTGGGTFNSGSTDFGFYAPFAATITGTGSIWTVNSSWRAVYAIDTLSILNGGRLVLNSYFKSEGYSGGFADITVSGPGSEIYQVNDVFGGQIGGKLVVSNGANVRLFSTLIDDPFNHAVVTVDGATMTNLDFTAIGWSTSGTMIVTNGGKVYSQWYGNAYDSAIGQFTGSTGTVQVVGSGSRWDNTHNLIVGGYNYYFDQSGGGAGYDGGIGTLKVGTGAVVTAGTTISIRSRGTLDLDGGTVSTPTLTLVSGGVLQGSGMINATVTNAGTLSPGHSVGAITVSNNLVLTSTSVANFGFDSATSFDQVSVGQSFTAGGVLNLWFNYAADTNTFTYYKIFDVGAGTGLGSFSQINWLGTPPLGGYTAGFIGNDFVITAIPEPGSACLVLAAGLGILALRSRRYTAK